MSATRPQTICGYAVEEEIGSGGMGVVLRARQVSLERPAVLKRLRRELAGNEVFAERFAREARAAAALLHPNVVAVWDCFTHRGDTYIAQEFVDGVDLRAAIERVGSLPVDVAAWIGLEVLRGLEAIHARGMVHRDLKPANVLLGRQGQVKIADFGIALDGVGPALTRTGTVVGTPPYMPPEQLQGERADARGDLFSTGVMLYEMLSGAPPWSEPDTDCAGAAESLLARMRRERYVPLRKLRRDVPRWLRRAIRRMLRGRPQKRAQTAAELRREFERRLGYLATPDLRVRLSTWLWDRGVLQVREGETVVRLATSGGAPPRRRRALAVAAVGSAVTLVAAGTGAILLADAPPWGAWPAAWPAPPGFAAAETRPATLSISGGEGLRVRIDGDTALAAEITPPGLELPAGPHTLVFEGTDGRLSEPVTIELAAGEVRAVVASAPASAQTRGN